MKVKIGTYKSFYGPYQLAETLCFWAKEVTDKHGFKSKPEWVHDFGEWLAHGSVEPDPEVGEIRSFNRERKTTLLYKFLLWIDQKRKRKIHVKIDRWDTWSADHTLALIILPMLKQLKANKNGSPFVDDDDVPDHLKSTRAPELTEDQKNTGDVDDNHHLRWEYVMDEMIFAFENVLDDSWEDQFHTGEYDWASKKLENGMYEMITGPNDTSKTDWDGKKAYQERISNGLKLFGKYYQSLWT
jgi:hypothetical protein